MLLNCVRYLMSKVRWQVYGFLDRLLGYHAVSVLINYNFRYIDDAGAERERFVETIVPLSSCGQVLLEPLRGGED